MESVLFNLFEFSYSKTKNDFNSLTACLFIMKSKEEAYENYIRVYNETKSFSQTSRIFGVTANTIRNALAWEQNGKPKIVLGRKEKLNDQMKLYIIFSTILEPTLSGEDLSDKLFQIFNMRVSRTTINDFRNKISFKYGSRIPHLPLTQNHKIKRINFSNEFLQSNISHRNVIFSDEKWFYKDSLNSNVWKLSGYYYPQIYKTIHQKPLKVLIWGGIGYNYKTKLIFINETINSETYIEDIILSSDFAREAYLHFGENQWVFQQDNAPPHVSSYTIDWLDSLNIPFIENWPPVSPDLSPIETIWAIMSIRVEKLKPKNLIDLKNCIEQVWSNLSFETINKLIDEFPLKLNHCIQHQGEQVRLH